MDFLDTLLVAFGLETSGFKKGTKEVEEGLKKTTESASKTAKDLEAGGKLAAQFFGKIRNEALLLTGALLGASGVKQFVTNIVATDAALSRTSKNLGMSVEQLSLWGNVAERLGQSSGDMEGVFRKIVGINQEIGLFGGSASINPLVRAGVNMAMLRDETTSTTDKMLMLSDAAKSMSPQNAQSLFQAAGFTEGQINLLMRGSEELRKFAKEQENIGYATKADADAAMQGIAAWKELSQQAQKTGRDLATAFGPVVIGALSAVSWWMEGLMNRGKALGAVIYDLIWGDWGDLLKDAKHLLPFYDEAHAPEPGAPSDSGSLGDSILGKLIGRGEGGYNSVAGGGTADLSNMTVAEVMRAQASGSFGAAGKYQIIGSTLSDAASSLGLNGTEKFDKDTQDRIFEKYLIGTKRKEIDDYINGRTTNLGAALKAAAMEWASVADPTTGQSYYAGVGSNRASITANEMAQALNSMRNTHIAHSSSSEVHVGTVNVVTQATDAKGIARSIKPAMEHYSFASNGNTGMD